jgi:ligand-binding sensor domain-containing protein/signal transduction histidine kinase
MKVLYYKIIQYLFCIILVWACLPQAQAQLVNLKLDHYNTDDGLSQNQIYGMVQDKQGFIWFATDEGLNRFDGYEFKVFRHTRGDSTALADNSIHALLLDRTDVLWIGTNNGLSQYRSKTEGFKNLPIDVFDIKKFNGNSVNVIREDSKGNIWIAYLGSGVDVVIPGEEVILHYTIHRETNDPYRIEDDYVIDLEFLPNGEVILGTRSGLIFLNTDGTVMSNTDALRKYPWKDKIERSIKCLTIAENGRKLWVGTELSGALMVDLSLGTVSTFDVASNQLLFNNNVPAIFEDSEQRIWVGGEAIYLYDPKRNSLIPFNEYGMRNNVETKNPILSIYEDRDNNIWFGSFRLGALQFNPRTANLIHYQAGQGPGSLSNNNVLSFAEDVSHNIWVGTDGGGLSQLSGDGSSFIPAVSVNKFSSQVIKCIYRDLKNNFWMGTWDGGMMRYHPTSNDLEIFNPDHKNFNSRHVWDIQPDKKGNLWIATLRDGLYLYSLGSKKFRYLKNDPADSGSLANNDVISLFIDSRNTLWAGTADGISVLYDNREKFVNLPKRGNLTNALCFFEDSKKRIWVGTNGGGIVILNQDRKVLKILDVKDGLPSPTICSMLADDHGVIWASSYNGLMKINVEDFKITVIPNTAGIQSKEFIARSSLKTSDGRLLFGGVNGFNIFHPDSLQLNQKIPTVSFTSLRIQNEEIKPGKLYQGRAILTQSISITDNIILQAADNSITLTFAPLVYNLQQNIHYTYKLENFDSDWQFTTADKRFVHYTSLDPGTYRLMIKASADGVSWPTDFRQLTIIVEPPWWATFPFRAAMFLAGFGILYGVYKTRVRILKKRQENLEHVVSERTRELRASNQEIQALLKAVDEQKQEIEEKNHELMQVNDAVVHQRDDLELKSQELEKAQARLKEINSHLEGLVERRTQKLSNTLRELETFLYRASHDLRGPISSMLGILNISELEKDNEQLKKTYSELFHKSVLQLDRTLQSLLLKHTIERKKLVQEAFNKADLEIFIWEINRSIPSFRVSDFKVVIDSQLSISIDRLILKTILASLLENAFFYSANAADKTVTLEVKSLSKEYIIVVSDHGAGVRPDQQEKIFEMFYRGHELSTGNGLGLYMVKSALEKVNGRISLESEPPKYSIFQVVIPK